MENVIEYTPLLFAGVLLAAILLTEVGWSEVLEPGSLASILFKIGMGGLIACLVIIVGLFIVSVVFDLGILSPSIVYSPIGDK